MSENIKTNVILKHVLFAVVMAGSLFSFVVSLFMFIFLLLFRDFDLAISMAFSLTKERLFLFVFASFSVSFALTFCDQVAKLLK